jgi:mannose/fructose/N-acetylgalactosamine-specific phosphotransferase system component IID
METSHDLTNLSHIFIVMGTNNLMILILWFCIQNGLHLMCHVYFVKFGIKQGHQVHIKIYHDITTHLETRNYHVHLKDFEHDMKPLIHP